MPCVEALLRNSVSNKIGKDVWNGLWLLAGIWCHVGMLGDLDFQPPRPLGAVGLRLHALE